MRGLVERRGRSERWWRLAARGIVAEHEEETLALLERSRGLLVERISTSRAGGAGVAAVAVPGSYIQVADVAPGPLAALERMAGQACTLTASGRYGPYWWLSFAGPASGPESVTILGSRVTVRADGRWPGEKPAEVPPAPVAALRS